MDTFAAVTPKFTAAPRDYRVTAIVSLYAAERFVRGCLDDLLGQTLGGDLEILVVDSASPQNEATIVAEYAARHNNITYLRTSEREGVYAAWNRGWRLAQGRYLTNANADDRHHPRCLERLAMALDARQDCDLAYGQVYFSQKENETFAENDRRFPFYTPAYFAPLTALYFPFGPQPLWRRSLLERVGDFDASYKAAGDWDFAVRTALASRAVHVPEAMGLYLVHEAAITFRDDAMGKENERIKRAWRRPEHIETLYRQAGAPLETARQRAAVHYDMGRRALEYFTPWGRAEAERDLEFAMLCFSRAKRLSPEWDTPRLGMAVIMALRGRGQEARSALAALAHGPCGALAARNLDILAGADALPGRVLELQTAPSELEFPSQLELAMAGREDATGPPVIETGEERKRVLLVGEFFWPSRGGIETFLEELGAALVGAGYAVDVATKPWSGRDALVYRGIRIQEFGFWHAPTVLDAGQFQSLLDRERYRAVVVIGHPAIWMLPVFTILRRTGQRLLYLPSINSSDYAAFKQGHIETTLRFLLACTNSLIRVTESGYDARLLAEFGRDVYFIPHAVTPEPAAEPFRERFGFRQDLPLFVMASNFWPIKNHLGLLRVLSRDRGKWQLAMIGNPHVKPYFKAVTAAASADPRVRVLGLLSRKDTNAAIRDADIVLLPSLGESAGPFVIQEAMALGTPWIATPHCNAVLDEAGGLVVEVERFPQAIHALLRDRGAAAELGKLGQLHWRRCFCWEQVLDAFIALIEGDGSVPDLTMPRPLRKTNALLQKRLIGRGYVGGVSENGK